MKTSIIAFCIFILTAACKDTTPVVSYDNSPTDSSDKTAPTISSTSPSSGETTISISANITVTFSEEIDSSTINTSNITVQDSNGNVVKGVVSYSNRVATFNPISDLSYFTTYTVLVGIGVRDTSGNYIASLPNTSWSFTTEANNDTSAPTISYSSPSSGATNISATTDITITFSEDMDPSTINTTNISMFDNASNSVSGTVTYSSKVATFSPSSDLNWSTTYTVMVGVGVKDSSGNPMAGGGGWHFTTATSMSAVRPTISSVYPTSGADNISLSDNITITFSGAMDTSTIITSNTLNGTNITLQDSSGNSIQGAITYNNQVATFNPLSDLSYSETYTITISTSVASSSGNLLAIPYSWSFQTVLNTPTSISAGVNHTCAVYFDNTIKCSGSNSQGNLGNGTGVLSLTPVKVTGITTANAISVGYDYSCAMLANKTIRCWGEGSYGQLGDGSTTTQYVPASAVSGITNGSSVSASSSHTCALLDNGSIKCWGRNYAGELGDGNHRSYSPQPTPVTVAGISNARMISTGGYNGPGIYGMSCSLLADSTIKCWGFDNYGQLGSGARNTTSYTCGSSTCTEYYSITPVSVNGISTASVIETSLSYNSHTCAIVDNGSIKCWGYNGSGQLGGGSNYTCGAGTNNCSATPISVSGIANATSISLGSSHTCAIVDNGSIKCWGYNGSGQLGDGTTTNRSTPVSVSGITTATAISAGYSHTCALLDNKTVQCWGSNSKGTFGDGTGVTSSTPVPTLF